MDSRPQNQRWPKTSSCILLLQWKLSHQCFGLRWKYHIPNMSYLRIVRLGLGRRTEEETEVAAAAARKTNFEGHEMDDGSGGGGRRWMTAAAAEE